MSEPDLLIETDRLLLRRFTAEDGEALCSILTDPEVCYFEPYEVMEREAALAEAEKLSKNDEFFAVIEKASGKLVGKLYFTDIQFFNAYEIGYAFARAYWGRGYAGEAARGLMQYAFTEMGVRRIVAEADVRNTRSCRVLEKLGMRKEGIFRQSAAYQKDDSGAPVWSDYCSYAILRNEFLK